MMRKLRILQVNKLYYPVTGGVERVVQQLAEGLRDITETSVLVCQKKGPRVTEFVNGVAVHRSHSLGVAFSMPLSLSFLLNFRSLCRNKDLVQLHMPFPLSDIALRLSGYRGKVLLWWHSDIVKQKKLLLLYKPLLQWTLRRADAIIVATEGHISGSDFLEPYRNKCHIIPFGVDPVIMERSTAVLQSRLDAKNRPLSFLFVGRLVYYKGCDVLLHAFAQSELTNATLTVVGNGPLLEELRALAASLGIAKRIIWKKGLSDVALADEFAACDVFVLPSIAKSEAFGLVQIEAMAYAKPVINTNLSSGVPYVSLDGVTGLTVAPADINALTAAICWMSEHPNERLAMGQAARNRVENEFTMPHMLKQALRLYQDIAR